ncbi:hypothetical protein G6F24_018796 [Rhizopus arrhizus]|nr:hypothetical protein G6F24_018796 [Rhizopus arrhizus]
MRAHIDLVHTATHRRDRTRQAFLHALERREQLANLVGVAHVHAGGQVAACDAGKMMAGVANTSSAAMTQPALTAISTN